MGESDPVHGGRQSMVKRPFPEPYKIKMVEPINLRSPEERERAIKEAGYNTFLLKSEDVFIDLLTDSGTGAMSENQWAGLMLGDEAYAGSKNFYNLCNAVKDILGYELVVPTHQGRGAEHLFFQAVLKKDDVVPMNMYFTTTRQHAELAGGIFKDVIIDEAHDPASEHPFKGNVDFRKLEALVEEYGVERIPWLVLAPNVNMAGGQPFSIANLREAREFCDAHNIKLALDITRIAENAYFIKVREPEFKDASITEILHTICSFADASWMSAKKDGLVNIGGFLGLPDREYDLFDKLRNMVVVFEGLHTYGGMAGRDMEALARGLKDVAHFEYLRARISQIEYFHSRLNEAGIPVVKPCGGHGVFLDARSFLPHIDQDRFPAQMLAAQIYLAGGVRSMERGNVSAGRDPETGKNRRPKLELVRLTVPRRVYTQTHMDYAADSIVEVWEKRERIPGLKFVYEPPMLRFFQARFEPIG